MAHQHDRIPIWSGVAPIAAGALLTVLGTGIFPAETGAVLAAATLLLGLSVFAGVHHAEVLALRLGEPFGSILLAVSVTIIEVGLILSIMTSGSPGMEAVARDTVFAAVMLVLNGVVGLCLVLGGRRYGEQSFRLEGASSAMAVCGTLAVITLVLPDYTLSASGPAFSPVQLGFVGVAALALYAVFVFVQTIGHRDYFLDAVADDAQAPARPPRGVALVSLTLLVACLLAVVLLAKLLSHPLEDAVAAAGLPESVVGVVVAAVVLLPESIAAAKAAIQDRLQNSLNLALGSAIASIGLTIPAVAAASLLLDIPLHLGLPPAQIVLLVLTLFMGTLTLGTGRTTVLQGAVHLVICACFLMVAAVP